MAATVKQLRDLRAGDQVNDTQDEKIYVLGEPLSIQGDVIVIVTDEGKAKVFDRADLPHLEAQKNS